MSSHALLPRFNDPRLTDPKHRLNEGKLYVLLKDLPPPLQNEMVTMSWEQAFEAASEAEATRRQLPVTDPAWARFNNEVLQFLKLAELLEQRQFYLQLLV